MFTTFAIHCFVCLKYHKMAIPQVATSTPPSTSSETVAGCEEENLEENTGPPWDRLPAHIVSKIAWYLYPWERVRMAKACSRWYTGVLRAPSLWRSTEIQLRGNWRDYSEIEYIRYLGRYLKRLTVCGAIRCHRHTKKFQRSVTTVFAHLYRQGPVQLTDLTITEFHLQSYFRGTTGAGARSGVLRSINRFLRQQRMLRAVDLSFNTMNQEEGVTVLTSLATSRSASKIQRLNIEELFKNKQNIFESDKFVQAVTQFLNLKLLVINYSCLSNELLCGLGNHGNYIGKMERLDVRCSRSDSSDHMIHPTSWQSFKMAFPHVRVHFRLYSWIKLNDLQRILVSEIPLTNLVILGHNDDSFQPDRTLRLVARNYRSVS